MATLAVKGDAFFELFDGGAQHELRAVENALDGRHNLILQRSMLPLQI